MTAKYTGSNIKTFDSDTDKIRAKTAMYVGSVENNNGLFTIVREPVDNSSDEASAGRNDYVGIHLFDDGAGKMWVGVVDHGHGIPTEMRKVRGKQVSTLEAVFTELQAGGKFDDKAYETSLGCFVGPTKIMTLDGRNPAIEDLYAEWKENRKPFYVVSYDFDAGSYTFRECYNVQLTKRVDRVAEVTLDNGEVHRCTVDHPFYSTSGEKIEAGKLKAGQSLLSLTLKQDKDGYLWAKELGGHHYGRLHRHVASFFDQAIEDRHVHHLDENVLNNSPENLTVLTPKQHWDEHPEKSERWQQYLLRSSSDKSKMLTKANSTARFNKSSLRGKMILIGCRCLHEGERISKRSYRKFWMHGAPSWKSVPTYFGSTDNFQRICHEKYDNAKDLASRKLQKGVLFLQRLSYEVGLSAKSVVLDNSDVMEAKRQVGKAITLLAELSASSLTKLSPSKYNDLAKGRYPTYAKVSSYIDFEDLKSCVRQNGPVEDFLFEDLSAKARAKRIARAEYTELNDLSKARVRSNFLRKCNVLIAKHGKVTRKLWLQEYDLGYCQSSIRAVNSWALARVVMALDYGVVGLDNIQTEAATFNHKVVKVRILKLKSQVPVYGMSVRGEHNYMLASGVLVANTHGVGVTATNALSETLEVWSQYRGKLAYLKFKRGQPQGALSSKQALPSLPGILKGKGTVVRFVPDASVLGKKTSVAAVVPRVKELANRMAYLNPGLTVELYTNIKGKKEREKHHHKGGIADYLKQKLASLKCEALGKPFVYAGKVVRVAFSFTDADEPDMMGHTNSMPNIEGGTHLDALWATMHKTVSKYRSSRDREFTLNTLREGVIGFLDVRLSSPQFDSQTKEKLVDKRARELVVEQFGSEFDKWCASNKALIKRVIQRAGEMESLRQQHMQDKKALRALKTKRGARALPEKLAKSRAPQELFLVEGESAGGCHFGDVEVLLANGTTKSFEQLAADFEAGQDNVGLAFDRTNQRAVPFTLYHPRVTKHVIEYVEMELSDGTIWRGTCDHPWLLTNGKYVRADQLKPGDAIQENRLPSSPQASEDSEPPAK